ncbi:uncharacterized protein LOC124534205 [Vanessa cardui]|uniref:uncharacterized protein LOC124534205 n=1 Tax=Vanessa cardui TaxID=171605 RepID=UPI001F12C09C|nr:uncharacterized protein LOC124534205 [Vanessa cardui]
MYRTIVVHPNDRHLQQIVWRDNPLSPIQTYQLNTVTYGTASAPFLATRCLRQLGLECDNQKVSEIILHDFYVDDLLTGGDDMVEIEHLRQEITLTLASAQMNLRKWKSNMQLVNGCDMSQSSLDLNIGGLESTKTLGLGWQAMSDELCFPISDSVIDSNSKREMLSVISQIFDPLGLLSPCVMTMKMLLQKLWLHKLSWDEQLPPEVNKLWSELIVDLPELNKIRIPRRVIIDSYQFLEFHIFCDASERAYGACLYVRSVSDEGDVLVRLLVAKGRVAPLKPTTIPRLELCGALVGVRIYEKVVTSLRVRAARTFFWSDSMIVLGWLKMLPNKLQPFVRNRIAEILDKTPSCEWRHVPTDKNPADYISRGVAFKLIRNLKEWWSGPEFLMKDMSCWPTKPLHTDDDILPEMKSNITILHALANNDELNRLINFNSFSNFLRLRRTLAWVLRFVDLKCKKIKNIGPFSSKELQRALNVIIRASQSESFIEYTLLINKKKLPKKSPLNKFKVFLDDQNIMRVGGRLQNSNYQYDKKHPILLHSNHRFTVRFRGETVTPTMGYLPQQRLLGGFPFENIGLDYAGPIQSAVRQGREDNLPPLKWRMGRIVFVHPGPDGIVRVADVKTSNGVVRRSFSKICPLPDLSEDGNSG